MEKLAELEVIESELYFISETIDNSIETKEVKELRKKIKDIIDEINAIIEQYNLYSRSYDLNNVIGIDDDCLVNDIIDYRNRLDNYGDKKKFVKEYKLLDEFKSLYTKLQSIKIETENVDKKNEEVITKYDIRDKKYDKVKEKFLYIKNINKEYLDEINKQNESLNELMKKLSIIDSEEYVTGRWNGLNQLIGQTFKLIGLKLLSPLSGFVPSIVGETILTRNMIKGIYKNLHYEKTKHIHYSGIDYDRELNNKLTDINYVENLVDDASDDLKKLKEEFLSIYNINIPGYEDTLKNINKMEEVIYKNQYKVRYVKDKLKLSKKINSDKMIRVRELNKKAN